MELVFYEDGFLTKTLDTHEEFEAAYRLRHEVFSRELKWVPCSPDGLEVDPYDSFAQCIGVFDSGFKLMGHARLIKSPNPFMVEKEFAHLVQEGTALEKGADVAEVTRLCVGREGRFTGVSNLLYKGIYQWSLFNGVRHLVMVVEKKYYRLLRLNGFPVRPAYSFLTMPDGVKAAVITLDWREFEELASKKRPGLLAWISKLPDRRPSRSRLHGLY